MTLQPLQRLSIIGGGSWATALVKIFSEGNITVNWHLRSQGHVDYLLTHARNPNYLGFLQLDLQHIYPTSNLEKAIASSNDILFAVPSAYLEQTVAELDENVFRQKNLYVSIKGLIPPDLLIPSVYLSRRFAKQPDEIIVLSGPCHAEEIAMNRKTYLTVAGKNPVAVMRTSEAIRSGYVTVIQNNDPIGVEYSSVLKNIIGIAGGLVKGANYGDNFLAVVVSNAMREMKFFLQVIDNKPRDLYDSAYFGDLLVTAYSEFSRNRTFGQMIGRGYSIPMAEDKMTMVVEGFPAVKGIQQLADLLKVKMPVVSAVYRILYQHSSAFTEFKLLENQLR